MTPRTLALVLVFSALPVSLGAQGFGIYEHGACMMARAQAGVAAPCEDGSAIADNPAGIAGREGLAIGSGGLLVLGQGSFTGDDGSRTATERVVSPLPFAYVFYGASPRLAVGVGMYVPYGLGIKWPLDFAGRFVTHDSTLGTLYVQPTVAYALSPRLTIGGGPTFARSWVDLHRREDLSRVPLGATGLTFAALVSEGTDFAATTLRASGATGVGFHVGTLLEVHSRVRLGARYLAPIELAYEGEAMFRPISGIRVSRDNVLGLPIGTPLDGFVGEVLQALPDQQGRTELEMPAQFVAGARIAASGRLDVLLDYHWAGWSAFDSITLDFSNPATPDERLEQNYRNSHSVRAGGEWAMNDSLRLRAGYAFTSAAAPDETVTPLLPEAERHHLTAGLGFRLSPRMTLDLAYQFVAHADRRGRTVNPPLGARPTSALNTGLYRSRGDLLGVTVTFRP